MNEFDVLFAIILIGGSIFLLRALGAWMLRINDVIKLLKDILEELKKQKGN